MHFSTESRVSVQPIHTISATAQLPLGTIVRAYDGLLGEGEFIYLAGVASVVAGSRVTYDQFTGATTLGVITANTGLPVAFATAALVAGTFGWFQISGCATVVNNATAVVGTGKIAASGAITSGAVPGGQVLGGVILVANGTTFTKTCTTRNGSDLLFVPDFDAVFVGCPISGTGIQATTFVGAGVDGSPDASATPGGRKGGYLKMTTVDQSTSRPATADGTVTVTFTRTNFSLFGGGGRFAVQGQIT